MGHCPFRIITSAAVAIVAASASGHTVDESDVAYAGHSANETRMSEPTCPHGDGREASLGSDRSDNNSDARFAYVVNGHGTHGIDVFATQPAPFAVRLLRFSLLGW